MKKPETHLVKKIRRALLERFGGFLHKNWGGEFTDVGLPDLEGCLGGNEHSFGIYIGCEVKIEGNEATAIQEEILRKIRMAGGIGFVARSVEDAIRNVEEALEASKGCRVVYIKETQKLPSHGNRNRKDTYDISERPKKTRKRRR